MINSVSKLFEVFHFPLSRFDLARDFHVNFLPFLSDCLFKTLYLENGTQPFLYGNIKKVMCRFWKKSVIHKKDVLKRAHLIITTMYFLQNIYNRVFVCSSKKQVKTQDNKDWVNPEADPILRIEVRYNWTNNFGNNTELYFSISNKMLPYFV